VTIAQNLDFEKGCYLTFVFSGLCLTTLEFGDNVCNACDFKHCVESDDVLEFYIVIRDNDEVSLPPLLQSKNYDATKKSDRLCAIYHCHKMRIQAQNSRHRALLFLNDLLNDMKTFLRPQDQTFQMALKQLSCDLQLFYPISDFRLEFESMAIGNFEINDIIVAVERFIELATMIQNDDLSIKLAWQAYEYSLSAGKYSASTLKNPFSQKLTIFQESFSNQEFWLYFGTLCSKPSFNFDTCQLFVSMLWRDLI